MNIPVFAVCPYRFIYRDTTGSEGVGGRSYVGHKAYTEMRYSRFPRTILDKRESYNGQD